jgi:hypothetical protein
MSLIITFMFEPAKLQMNWASASGAKNLRLDKTEAGVVWSVACIAVSDAGDLEGGEDRPPHHRLILFV